MCPTGPTICRMVWYDNYQLTALLTNCFCRLHLETPKWFFLDNVYQFSAYMYHCTFVISYEWISIGAIKINLMSLNWATIAVGASQVVIIYILLSTPRNQWDRYSSLSFIWISYKICTELTQPQLAINAPTFNAI